MSPNLSILLTFHFSECTPKFYLVNMTEQEYSYFKEVHNYVINVSEWKDIAVDKCNLLCATVCEDAKCKSYFKLDMNTCEAKEKVERYFMKWADNKIQESGLINTRIDAVISTGVVE